MENTHCRHWQGSINDICGAGFDWQEVTGGPQAGIMTRCPCVNFEHSSKCNEHELLTQEEFEQQEKLVQEIIEQTVSEMPFWDQLKSENKPGTQGICKCPRCGGDCAWSIASVNGHLWVCCKTKNCIRFME